VSARDEILCRVRTAVAGAASTPAPHGYAVAGVPGVDPAEAFAQRVRAYDATVIETGDLARTAGEALAQHGARRVGVAADLDGRFRPSGFELVEDNGLAPSELDGLDGALTLCAAACALTGTIALDGGPGQGRRALTLLPDLHVCVVRAEQIVATVPELVRRLRPSAHEGRPIVLVSGPSATSDIELERVEGVHGPRRLVVVLVR
jgi:L-lactate dehydrogenase complex protein LldG